MSQAIARYDEFAEWYEHWSRDVPPVIPVQNGLLPAVAGSRVLDAGCGQGRMSRYLAGLGAAVTGVDVSAAMIARAREAGPAGITYIRADVTSGLTWWDGRSFDGCTCEMALMDIDDLAGALSAVAAVLRPGGWFVASIVHPWTAVWTAAPISREAPALPPILASRLRFISPVPQVPRGRSMMRAVIVWWELARSAQTIESWPFAEVPGLRFKMWIADPQASRWGAVLLFETAEAACPAHAQPGCRADRLPAHPVILLRRRGHSRRALRGRATCAAWPRLRASRTQCQDAPAGRHPGQAALISPGMRAALIDVL